MPTIPVHSFLVHPGKNDEEAPTVSSATVREGRVHEMMRDLFGRAEQDCDVPIIFRRDHDGQQQNPCRDLVIAYAENPSLHTARHLAKRLQAFSTHRSGIGLLFLMKDMHGTKHKVLLSRFPADSGVLATEHGAELSVDFVERVFMKNAKAYKCAVYAHESTTAGFWKGAAVDRQISGYHELSEYWIGEFLASDLSTTAATGTARLAKAMVVAARSTPDSAVRSELVTAVQMLANQTGRRSGRSYLQRIGLSDAAHREVEYAIGRGTLLDEPFAIDREALADQIPFKAVELDNGAVMIADTERFPEVFRKERLDDERVRYITEGHVVNEIIRKHQ